MDKAAKKRYIIFVLLLLIFAGLAVGHSYRLRDITDGFINLKKDIGTIYVDGEDFTLFAWLLGGIANAMMWPVLYVIYAVEILVVSLIGVIVFQRISLKDKSKRISSQEARVVSWTYGGMVILSLLFGFIMPNFMGLLPLFTYTGIWSLCVGCFCVWPIRKRAKEQLTAAAEN